MYHVQSPLPSHPPTHSMGIYPKTPSSYYGFRVTPFCHPPRTILQCPSGFERAFHRDAQPQPEPTAIQGAFCHRQFLRYPQSATSEVHGTEGSITDEGYLPSRSRPC